MQIPVDAVVVGSGPNGLTAAAVLAGAGRSVVVLEAAPTIGGGCRSAELTLPGYVHDVCAAVHVFGAVSPAFAELNLENHGLEWLHPDVSVGHPLDDGRAAIAYKDLAATIDGLGVDGPAYDRVVGSVTRAWSKIAPAILGPLLRVPANPLSLATFGARAIQPATMATRSFTSEEAKALFAGNAAHAIQPLNRALTSSFAMVLLGAGHIGGWPVARGGSQSVVDALGPVVTNGGGSIEVGRTVRTLADLPRARSVFFDVTPGQLDQIAGSAFPGRYRRSLRRFRHGAGAFKIDYALAGPVPWTNPDLAGAGTVHVGGTAAEITAAEAEVAAGRHPERPFVLVAQQSTIDPERAPQDHHCLWVYTHVPAWSQVDMTEAIERQIDRFAPGWRDLILARHVTDTAALESYNENYRGGDIAAGALDGLQLVARPFLRSALHPYRTPDPRLFLCSASTPPGAGVHGMCGYHAARDALATILR